MGAVSNAVSSIGNAVGGVGNLGLGMVTGGLAGPLVNSAGKSLWGGDTVVQGGMRPQGYSSIPTRSMPAAYNNPWIQQFIAQQRAGGIGQGGLPMGMNVMPLAMRKPVQQANPTPYQNLGMFGQYNPFMPRR